MVVLHDLFSTMGHTEASKMALVHCGEHYTLIRLHEEMPDIPLRYNKVLWWDVKNREDDSVTLEVEVGEEATASELRGRDPITLRDLLTTYKRWETQREVLITNTEHRVLSALKFGMGDKLENYFVGEDDEVFAWRVEKYDKNRDMYITFKVMTEK